MPVARPTRFGGNTPCVELTGSDGTRLILDAGTGIRELGAAGVDADGSAHILLTHLHLDHTTGLLFYPPFFDSRAEIVVWGPPPQRPGLQERLARYLSAPLSPIEIRDMAARVSFRVPPPEGFSVGSLHVDATQILHRGPTLGYCVSEGERSVCYLPDHEPVLGGPLDRIGTEWISGHSLAEGASLLIHDGQYTDDEYRDHVGWGHSGVSHALEFARRAAADRLVLFHHDPARDDDGLDAVERFARERWERDGRDPADVALAREGDVYEA